VGSRKRIQIIWPEINDAVQQLFQLFNVGIKMLFTAILKEVIKINLLQTYVSGCVLKVVGHTAWKSGE